eukprot:scaffold18177_cov61-Phaeocystis_antarctica.AAC.1
MQFGVFLPYKIPGKSQSNNQNAAKNQRIKSHLNPTHPIPLQNEIKTLRRRARRNSAPLPLAQAQEGGPPCERPNYITTHASGACGRDVAHAGNTAKPYAGPVLEQTRDSLASRRAAASSPAAALTCSAYCSDESERERARSCGGAHEGG